MPLLTSLLVLLRAAAVAAVVKLEAPRPVPPPAAVAAAPQAPAGAAAATDAQLDLPSASPAAAAAGAAPASLPAGAEPSPVSAAAVFDGSERAWPATGFDVIVVGAGPAGLTAALQARAIGLDVLVVEKRPIAAADLSPALASLPWPGSAPWGQRRRIVGLDRGALDVLASLDVPVPFAPLSKYTLMHGRNGSDRLEILQTPGIAALVERFLNRRFGGTVPIRDLELSLARTAARAGIKIIFGAEAEADGKGALAVRYPAADGVRAERFTGRFLVDASGARSPLTGGAPRRSLGFDDAQWVVGNFVDARAEAGEYRAQFSQNDHPYYALALSHERETTVYASPYDGQVRGPLEDVVVRAAARLGISGRYLGDAQLFTSRVDRLGTFFVDGFFVVGDAAQKADPASGLGVSMAVSDAARLRQLLRESLEAGKPDWAQDRFERRMARAVLMIVEQANNFNALRSAVRLLQRGPIQAASRFVFGLARRLVPR